MVEAALRTDEAGRRRPAVGGIERGHPEPRSVHAQPGHRPQPRCPLDLVLRVCAGGRLEHRVPAPRVEPDARFGVIETDRADVVVPDLHADRVLCRSTCAAAEPAVGGLAAGDEAMIRLFDLIAVDGIVQEVREVREEVEVVADAVDRDVGHGVAAAPLPLAGGAVAIRVAAVGRVDRAEPADDAVGDRRGRHLVGRIPPAVVSHRCQRQPVERVAARIADDPVQFLVVVGVRPRAVVVLRVERRQEAAAAAPPATRRRARGRTLLRPLRCGRAADRARSHS